MIEKQFESPRVPKPDRRTVLPTPRVPGAPPKAGEIVFRLKAIDFEGTTVFSAEQLQQFAKDMVGHEIRVSDLFTLAQTVTKAYSDSGYPLAVALVPKQDITAGTVKILIVEGYVADVEIAGDPGHARGRLEALGEKLKAERPLKQKSLERYVLLANELPGLDVHAVLDRDTLQNGQSPGGVKVILNVAHKVLDASAGIDNRGSKALGPERGRVDIQENGALLGAETMGVGLVQSPQTRELTYAHGEATAVLNAEGTTASLSGTWSRSKPGVPLLRLVDFNSNGWTASFELSHPLLRTRAHTLRLFAGFELKDLSSDLGPFPNSHDKLSVFQEGARFDFADGIGGTSQIDVTLSEGVALFNATRQSDALKSRANGAGEFTTLTVLVGHLQPIARNLTLWVSTTAQVASRALLASEQCGYGGSYYGRGFDSYEIAGDQCIVGMAELRYSLLAPGMPSVKLQPFGFYDAGLVSQKGMLLAGESRQQTGQSLGAGLRFELGEHVRGSVEFDQPLARVVALEGNKNGRVFFNLITFL